MGIRIDLDLKAINGLKQAVARAAGMAAEALKTDVTAAQVMPFDTGDMQNNETFVALERSEKDVTARLITGSPQARRLYYHPEYNFQTVNNPNVGGLWLEPWLTGDRADFLEDSYRELLRREAGL